MFQLLDSDVGKIFSTIGQHHKLLRSGLKELAQKNRLSCTGRNRNFRSENWCVNDDIICIYKLNNGAN